jgi:hypothetical protein
LTRWRGLEHGVHGVMIAAVLIRWTVALLRHEDLGGGRPLMSIATTTMARIQIACILISSPVTV